MAIKAPPGMQLVKNKKTGKYRMVPVKGAKAGAKPVGDPFVQNEIDRQIGQDAQLTQFVDTRTGDIAKLMADQAAQSAQIAGQFKPVTAYVNPTLDANAQNAVASDAALTNAVAGDQQKALAALIANTGSAGSQLMGNIRGAGQTQHRDYARYVQGQKPALEERRRGELANAASQKLDNDLKRAQMQLAQDQFGLQVASTEADNTYRYDALNAQAAMAADKEKPKGNPGKYGNIDKKYDGAIDEVFNLIVGIKGSLGQPIDPKNPEGAKVAWKQGGFWRDGFALLKARGLKPATAALLATSWAREHSPETFSGSTPAKIKLMLDKRKVPIGAQKRIIVQAFGATGWAKAQKAAVKPTKPKMVSGSSGSVSTGGSGGTVVAAP